MKLKHKTKRRIAALLMLSSIICGVLFVPAGVGKASFEGFHEICGNSQDNNQNSGDTTNSTTDSVTGSWAQKNTKEYQNAKALFDACRDLGFSGVQSCAILGNALHESGGLHDLKQSGGANVMGIFQFTGSTLAAIEALPGFDPTWSAKGQLHEFIEFEKSSGFPAFMKVAQSTDDVKTITDAWCDLMERPGVPAKPSREAYAQQALTVFNAADLPGDLSKLAGISSGMPSGGNAGESGDQAANPGNCAKSDDGAGGAEDGTGQVPEDAKGKIFAANEIPDDLKKFLLPINVSDSRGVSGEKWAHPGGECVDYSVSEACALWKDTSSWSQGNGVDQVNAAISHGYAVKDDKPHAGDIVSCDGTDPSVGHTWIVGHVFADGSVLVQEQNFPGKSGDDMGIQNSWDVGILPPWNNGDGWHNVKNWGSTMDHAKFAKPKNGMKKNPS